MNFFSSRSSIYFFSSTNSTGAILYGATGTGPAPRIISMVKTASLLGGNSDTSSRKTLAYSSTTRMLLICSIVLFFFPWAIIIKQIAPSYISFNALWVEISSSPSVSGNTTLHHPQSITIWLLDSQSIPIITSKLSIGKRMRFTLNLQPATSIGHPTQTKLVDTWPNASVATISSHPRSRVTSSSFLTQSLDTNEWVAPESYNATTLSSKSKQVFYTKLPDWVASVLVKAYTRPTALGCSPSAFFVGAPLVSFLLGHYREKCLVCSQT